MIRTISPQDMREMERAFLEGTGYPSILLMEHAAQPSPPLLPLPQTNSTRLPAFA